MKAYKVEILIINFEELSQEETKDAIENANYAGDCISPDVISIEEADIGEWSDDHPLNQYDKMKDEYTRMFHAPKVSKSGDER
ncbi:hypothetical protein LCGC14_0425390 [marine sediment metagenome]|uniref:Uncharacterized protein n=1 Tax=marine sediment metagenome TaxID=412755 RepID=A0A0F9T7L2_9ZZZZ